MKWDCEPALSVRVARCQRETNSGMVMRHLVGATGHCSSDWLVGEIFFEGGQWSGTRHFLFRATLAASSENQA